MYGAKVGWLAKFIIKARDTFSAPPSPLPILPFPPSPEFITRILRHLVLKRAILLAITVPGTIFLPKKGGPRVQGDKIISHKNVKYLIWGNANSGSKYYMTGLRTRLCAETPGGN